MADVAAINRAFQQGRGVFRLAPTFVPRRFNRPGRRLKLHPDDLFALGLERGAIKERWLASVTAAQNGPGTPPDEGLSYAVAEGGERFLLRDAVQALGKELLGEALWRGYGRWPAFAKLFDYQEPLFHHLHLDDERAALTGQLGKPEAYYFPAQLNNHLGAFPVTYFGYDPDLPKEAVRARLAAFERRDTRITELSRAYRLELGTGWYVPPGLLHAPGSLCTYEPQWASDVVCVHENVASGEVVSRELLVRDVPEGRRDLDFLMELVDWEKNVDPHFRKHFFRPPVPAPRVDERLEERWITYANPYFSAKEVEVAPGAEVRVRDPAAHGCLVIQGHGRLAGLDCESPTLVRFGQMTADEFFVSAPAAREGITVRNESRVEPLVLLQQFGPDHPAAPQAPPT